MKKLIALIMAAGFVLGSLGTAAAVDVKVNGQWQFAYGYYSNHGLYDADKDAGKRDPLTFRMRLRTQVNFIVSETLSTMLNFELGDIDYGRNGSAGNGMIDTDGNNAIKLKHAYLDWTIPGTQIKTRQGLQGIRMPWVVAGNPVMDADVAGVSVSTQFSPEIGLTVYWARPFDKNEGEIKAGGGKGNDSYDEMDMFGIMVPIKTQAVRMTPWVMGAMIGKDSGYYGSSNEYITTRGRGRQGYDDKTGKYSKNGFDSDTYGWWAGTTFELPLIDPAFIKIDAMMGGLKTGDSAADTFGYFVSTSMGYKFAWGTPALFGWYSSGDKDKDDYGQIPLISDDNGFFMTSYGLQGKRGRSLDAALSTNGIGMWGIGAEVKDISFIQNLTHTVRVAYMRGTNKGDAGITGDRDDFRPFYGTDTWGTAHRGYLMTSDSAWEINLLNAYRFSKNFEVALDFAYLNPDMGPQHTKTDDSFATMLSFMYNF